MDTFGRVASIQSGDQLAQSVCLRGHKGPAPQQYRFEIKDVVYHVVPINATDVEAILSHICEGPAKHSNPKEWKEDCPKEVFGCSWLTEEPSRYIFHGLVDKVSGRYQFLPGYVVPNFPNPPAIRATATYPVAPVKPSATYPDPIVITPHVGYWTLSNNDRALLRRHSPELLAIAEQAVEAIHQHELTHVDIWRHGRIPDTMTLVNFPPVPIGKYATMVQASTALSNSLDDGFDRIAEDDNIKQESFDQRDAEFWSKDEVSLDRFGLGDFWCPRRSVDKQ